MEIIDLETTEFTDDDYDTNLRQYFYDASLCQDYRCRKCRDYGCNYCLLFY